MSIWRLIRTPDVGSGILFMAFALLGFFLSWDLPTGSAMSMGPGYLPQMISGILLVFGLLVSAAGLARASEVMPIAGWSWAALTLILISVGAFAIAIERLGLVVAIILTALIAIAAGRESRWAEAVMLTAGLSVFSVVLFVYAIYMLVVTGFLRGTVGPNQYGPDPLGAAAPAAA